MNEDYIQNRCGQYRVRAKIHQPPNKKNETARCSLMYSRVGYNGYYRVVAITYTRKLSWIKSHSRARHMNGKVSTRESSYRKVTSISSATGERFKSCPAPGDGLPRYRWRPVLVMAAKSGSAPPRMHMLNETTTLQQCKPMSQEVLKNKETSLATLITCE